MAKLFPALLGVTVALIFANAESPTSDVARLENRVREKPDDFVAWTMLGQRQIAQARATGDLAFYEQAEASFQAALREFAEHPGALAGLAWVRLALHRFGEARELAEQILQRAPRNLEARLLMADAQLALGNADEAATISKEMEEMPAVLSRRAELALRRGENEEAVRFGLRAAEAAEARGEGAENVAIARVRVGEMFFRRGRLAEADEQYRLAETFAPQNFSLQEHVAELRGAQEKFPEAIALYQKLIAQSHRPDMEQALGDLYAFMRKPEQAKPWHDKALAGYLASVERGEVHFVHHLAGFYADVREDGIAAVKWARKDLAARQSVAAHEALAWALYRAGEFAESHREIEAALEPGIKDAHITYHAALIFSAAGDLERGRKFMEEAASLNPLYLGFHVHR